MTYREKKGKEKKEKWEKQEGKLKKEGEKFTM